MTGKGQGPDSPEPQVRVEKRTAIVVFHHNAPFRARRPGFKGVCKPRRAQDQGEEAPSGLWPTGVLALASSFSFRPLTRPIL